MPDPRKERGLLALEEGEIAKLDPITNILHLMAANDWATQVIVRREKFKAQVVKRWGIVKRKGDYVDPEVYRPFTHQGKEYSIPLDVEAALQHVNKLWSPTAIENPLARNVLRFYDGVLGVWKIKALNKPGYVTRNLFGNLTLMQAGGMQNWGNVFAAINIGLQGHTRDAARAELVRLVRQGADPRGVAGRHVLATVDQHEKIRRVVLRSKQYFAEQAEKRAGLGHLDVNSRRWTEREIYDLAERLGVINRGFSTIDLARGAAEDFTTRKASREWRQFYKHIVAPFNVFGGQHVAAQVTGALAKGSDNLQRLAFFTDRLLAHGMTPEGAAADVAKFLFNYKDLTKFDRGMKRLLPFYTWMRKNLPLQLELAIRTPRNFSLPFKVGRAFDRRYRQQVQGQAELLGKDVPWQTRRYQGMRIGPQDAQALRGFAEDVLPEFMSARMVPAENELNGMVILAPDMPWNQPNDLMVANWEGPVSMLSPVVKVAAELGSGSEFRPGFRALTEEPLPGALQGAGEAVKALAPDMVWRSKKTGLWVGRPALFRTLKAANPDLAFWEKLLVGPIGKSTAEQATRQRLQHKLRVTSELTGVVRTQILDERDERSRALARQVGDLEEAVKRREHTVGPYERPGRE